MKSRRAEILATIALTSVIAATPALADAIDGDWCAPSGDRHMRISGPNIITPSGQATTGNYTRHAFSYTVAEGDPDAGTSVQMLLLNDEELSVSEDGAPPVIWLRCEVIA